MAVGKTTYGKQIAKALQYNFIDLDEEIEKGENMSIVEIFESKGEETFRIIEKQNLNKTFALEKTVIACGGGTPCYFDNIKKMNKHGITVWLKATPMEIAYRVLNQKNKRPLLNKVSPDVLINEIELKLKDRIPFYNEANYNFWAKEDEILNFITIFTAKN